MTENQTVSESIDAFLHNRAKLEAKEDDDLPDDKIDEIYRSISREIKQKKMLKQATLAASIVA